MIKILKITIANLVLFTMNSYGGSKVVAPVEAEVVAVAEDYSPLYFGVGLVATKFHSCGNDCSYEDETYGAMLRVGYDFNEYMGVEVRGMRTFLDEGPFGGAPLQHVGIFVKPQYPVSDTFNIYGLLGYGYTENLGNGQRLTYFDNDHGFSAGLGLEYDLSDRQEDFLKSANYTRAFDGYADQGKGWSLFLDYQRLLIKSDIPDMDAVSFGFRYDF
jgi:OOP family OmpA-OmpF porin